MNEEDKDIQIDIKTNVQIVIRTLAQKAIREAATDGKKVVSFEHLFGAQESFNWLSWNYPHNRTPSRHRVDVIRQQIEAGQWADGGQIRIALDDQNNYVIVDGQHRLLATAASSRPVWYSVVVDPRDADIAYAYYDTVASARTLTDRVSSFSGLQTDFGKLPYRINVVRAASAIEDNFTLDSILGKNRKAESVEKIVKRIHEYAEEIAWLTDHVPTAAGDNRRPHRAMFRPAMLSVALVVLKAHPAIAQQWILDAANDDGLKRNSPERKLSDLMEAPGGKFGEKRDLLFRMAAVWNAKLAGRELPNMPSPKGWPGILGTPFPK